MFLKRNYSNKKQTILQGILMLEGLLNKIITAELL